MPVCCLHGVHEFKSQIHSEATLKSDDRAGGDLVSSKDRLKLLLVLSSQLDVEGCHILLQVMNSLGARYREDILPLHTRSVAVILTSHLKHQQT